MTPAGPTSESSPLVTDSDGRDLRESVKILEERAHKTYLARIRACDRLTQRNNAWNTSLIAFATSTTIASVGIVVNSNMYGRGGDALLVALAILSLVASLVVSNVDYGSRARAMEVSYKRIQQISLQAESFFVDTGAASRRRYLELAQEYSIAIESSENHLTSDYLLSQGRSGGSITRARIVTFIPYITLIIPVLLLLPFGGWFFSGF